MSRLKELIQKHTRASRLDFLPELTLYLATPEISSLWEASGDWVERHDVPIPFWACAWAGGLGLARFILDHPEWVRGKPVLDVATGSGLVAIAAAKVGAASVQAVDVDPVATASAVMNAKLNAVDLDLQTRAAETCRVVPGTVVLAGDVFYDREMAAELVPWLRETVAQGATVLVGDPGRTYVPCDGVRTLAEMVVPTHVELEGTTARCCRILQFFSGSS